MYWNLFYGKLELLFDIISLEIYVLDKYIGILCKFDDYRKVICYKEGIMFIISVDVYIIIKDL